MTKISYNAKNLGRLRILSAEISSDKGMLYVIFQEMLKNASFLTFSTVFVNFYEF